MTDDAQTAQQQPLLNETDLSLNLDTLKKQAKSLRDGIRSGEVEALGRLKTYHPRSQALVPDNLKLADAQCVIARENGLSSWPALKQHVNAMDQTRAAIEKGETAPDGDLQTLHIRCGNDIEAGLRRAGFTGDFLMFADPLCQGPVPASSDDMIRIRARFIASEYPGEHESETIAGLTKAEDKLSAAHRYGRIVLWFEHDPYDQLILLKVLSRLYETGARRRKVEMVSLDRFPGIRKFIGIGQLSPTALRHMYGSRKPIAEGAYTLAKQAWHDLSNPSPEPLFQLSRSLSPALPFLAGAIVRYLQDLPSAHNGLSFSEEAALKIVREEPKPWGRIFNTFIRQMDPLPYHGDLMYLGTLLRLRNAGRPVLESPEVDLSPEGWGRTVFALTQDGHAVLNGALDWRDCSPSPRQHGGTSCFGGDDWRWDQVLRQPVLIR